MRILWITTQPLGPVRAAADMDASVSGGWLDAMYGELVSYIKERRISSASVVGENLELGLLCPGNVRQLTEKIVDGVSCHIYPRKWQKRVGVEIEKAFKEVNLRFRPDIVHVHGTEYPHGYNWVRANGRHNVLVSIQGLISVISRYYLGGIEHPGKYNTLRDILRHDSMLMQRRKFRQRGEWEEKLLGMVKYVAGRTQWDKAHAIAINPDVKYFHIGESLRDEFADSLEWSYSKCEPYTIFMSQGATPFKGTHKAIEAMSMVCREYPGAKLIIAGPNPISRNPMRLSGYGNYLKKLIGRYNLNGNVKFTGVLDAKGMINMYLSCNIYLLPSAIENSPNSLNEAVKLGVPRLSSICGGTPEMLEWNGDELYRYEETEMLAKKIVECFRCADNVTPGRISTALTDRKSNLGQLLEAYKEMAG